MTDYGPQHRFYSTLKSGRAMMLSLEAEESAIYLDTRSKFLGEIAATLKDFAHKKACSVNDNGCPPRYPFR